MPCKSHSHSHLATIYIPSYFALISNCKESKYTQYLIVHSPFSEFIEKSIISPSPDFGEKKACSKYLDAYHISYTYTEISTNLNALEEEGNKRNRTIAAVFYIGSSSDAFLTHGNATPTSICVIMDSIMHRVLFNYNYDSFKFVNYNLTSFL